MSVLRPLKPKLRESVDDCEVLGIKCNESGTDAATAESNEDVVDESNFLVCS